MTKGGDLIAHGPSKKQEVTITGQTAQPDHWSKLV